MSIADEIAQGMAKAKAAIVWEWCRVTVEQFFPPALKRDLHRAAAVRLAIEEFEVDPRCLAQAAGMRMETLEAAKADVEAFGVTRKRQMAEARASLQLLKPAV